MKGRIRIDPPLRLGGHRVWVGDMSGEVRPLPPIGGSIVSATPGLCLWENVRDRERVKLGLREMRSRWKWQGLRPWHRAFWSPWRYIDRPGRLLRRF